MDKKTAVLLLNFGGPASLEEVRYFLYNIFKDPAILPVRPGFLRNLVARFISLVAAGKSREKYRRIGGFSPLVDITRKQAKALEVELDKRGIESEIYIAMRYSEPRIRTVLDEMVKKGIDKTVILPLYPHFSITTSGSSFGDLNRELKKTGVEVETSPVNSYEDNPGYVEALADRLKAKMEEIRENGEDPRVVFSAHSLPRRLVEVDQSYLEGVRKTAELVAERAGIEDYEFAYQSGRKGWLGPTAEEKLEELAGKGLKSFVLVPLSFTCDNIETLYDLDISLCEQAGKLGVRAYRTESLNDSPGFIRALADIVTERLEQ